MNRREALRSVAILMGTAVSASTLSIISEGCKPSKRNGELFTAKQEGIIAELADTILPPTKTLGAKAAGVGPFIAMMIKECYPEKLQKVFTDGLDDLEKRSEDKYSNSFASITAAERTIVLQQLVDELKKKKADEKEKEKAAGAKKSTQTASKKNPNFFQLAKELTMLGYFTSEIGAKQALNYVPVPGKYDGCIDMTPGQKAWAL